MSTRIRLSLSPKFAALALAAIAVLVLLPAAAPAQPASAQEAIDTYGSAWGEPDEAKRRAILEKAWAEDGVYVDPTAEVVGREALVQHIGRFQSGAGANGPQIVVASSVDVHHSTHFRFSWNMVGPDGKTVITPGMDYGQLDEDGRIKLIVGFFGPFPPLAAASSQH